MEVRSQRRPSVEGLPAELRSVATFVAQRLVDAGFQAWIVGGAVRDLALGREPQDIDMASDALPDQVQVLFKRSLALGKAFGTMVVIVDGVQVQVTTFRAEEGYSDARRPDTVTYGSSVEVDARRRDFTCNAMYLDPLDDRFRDPEQGLSDLEQNVLRCVGDARRRFSEDGLRMVRLGRFCARLGLDPDPAAVEAAAGCLDVLRGVSGERLRAELEGLLTAEQPARGLQVLEAAGVLQCLLQGLVGLDERAAAVDRLEPPRTFATGLAVLLFADARLLEDLRPSRGLRREVEGIWRLGARLEGLLADTDQGRGARLEAMGDEAWEGARVTLAARRPELATGLAELEAERCALSPEELRPEPWIESADLTALGLAPGPRWGELLEEALRRQLDGQWDDRAEALEWLRNVAGGEAQDGGKAPRNPHESG